MERYGLTVHQAAALVLARRLLGCSERIPRRWVAPVGNGRRVRLHRTREEARVDVLGYDLGAAETGACSAAPAGETQIRFGLSCGLRLVGWLERGSARCSRVRFPGVAVLNCWDGGVAQEQRVRNG